MISSPYDTRRRRVALTVKVGTDDYTTVKGARPLKGATQAIISTLYARFAASLRHYGDTSYDQIATGALELVALPESEPAPDLRSEPTSRADAEVCGQGDEESSQAA